MDIFTKIICGERKGIKQSFQKEYIDAIFDIKSFQIFNNIPSNEFTKHANNFLALINNNIDLFNNDSMSYSSFLSKYNAKFIKKNQVLIIKNYLILCLIINILKQVISKVFLH